MPPLEQQQQQHEQQQLQLQQQILAGSNPVISLLDTLQSSSSLIVGSFGSLRREAILAHSPNPANDSPPSHRCRSWGKNKRLDSVTVAPSTSSSSLEDSPSSSWWSWPSSIASAKAASAGARKYKITIEQVQEDDATKKEDRKDLTTSIVSTTVMGPPGLLDWILFSTGGSMQVPTAVESADKQSLSDAMNDNNLLQEIPPPATTTTAAAVPPLTPITGQGQKNQPDSIMAHAQTSGAVTPAVTMAAAAATAPHLKQDAPRDLSSLPWWERRQIEVQMERQKASKAGTPTTAATTEEREKAVVPLSAPSTPLSSSASHQPREPANVTVSAPSSAPSSAPPPPPPSPPLSSRPFHETTTTLTRRDGSMEIRTVRFLDPNSSTNTSSSWPTKFVSETRYRELTAEGVLVRESVTRKDVQGRDRVVWERKWGRHHRTIPLEHRAAAEAAEVKTSTTTTTTTAAAAASSPVSIPVVPVNVGETTAMPLNPQHHAQGSSLDEPMDQIRHHLSWSERRRALREQRELYQQQQQQQQEQQSAWPHEQVPSDENHRWREWRERAYHRQQQQQQQQQQYGEYQRQREEQEAEEARQEHRSSRWHRYHRQYHQQRDEQQQSSDRESSPSSESFERRRSWPPKAYLRRQQQQQQGEQEQTPRHNV